MIIIKRVHDCARFACFALFYLVLYLYLYYGFSIRQVHFRSSERGDFSKESLFHVWQWGFAL